MPNTHDTDLSSIHSSRSIMLSIIRTTVIALALLIIPIHALTPAEVEAGKVEGFTGGTGSHSGDALTSTWCFCAQPSPLRGNGSEANYIQFEYYNFHHNTTYILSHFCAADSNSTTTCLAPRSEDGAPDEDDGEFLKICRTFYKHKGPYQRWDLIGTLCYDQDDDDKDAYWREWRMPGEDVNSWKGQERKLHPEGGRGPVLKSKEESKAKCDVLCDEHAHMPALRHNARSQCHVVVYDDLDDMCDGCT